jgi:hypothetical protein
MRRRGQQQSHIIDNAGETTRREFITRVAGTAAVAASGVILGMPLGPYSAYAASEPQPHWRFCGKCNGLFYSGAGGNYYRQNQRCPGGGLHLPLGYNFVLPHDVPGTPTAQTDWRFCGKCNGLFYSGAGGNYYRQSQRCPGGGLHLPLGYNFVIPHQPPVDGTTNMTAAEAELLRLINDARAHPEKYPPHGNSAGAAMVACGAGFQYSKKLADIARAHNNYLASQPINWVNTYPNMHKGPNGKLVWEPGEPMDQAGYHSYRSEIVATGFPTAADAVRFWMQDDAPSQWGHRNLILNCTIREAGPAHLQGGPGNHYWTVDMGNP